MVRVANSFVFKSPVVNYSGHFPFLWDEITIPIRYGSAYEEVRALAKRRHPPPTNPATGTKLFVDVEAANARGQGIAESLDNEC